MNPDLIRRAGLCLHGEHWKVPLAKNLGVNPRTVRGWVQTCPRSVPEDYHAKTLVRLLKQRKIDIESVIPELTDA